MLPKTQFEYFAACAPGLEAALLGELARLGFSAASTAGGVQGRTDWSGLFDLHLKSALAESIRVRLKSFEATSFAALEAELRRLPWHAFLHKGQRVEVSVTCHKSKLYHSDAVKERLLRVLAASLARGREPASEAPPARVFLRLAHDVVTPSIDTSGERLHRRGYRAHVEDAPLRETLAAAMVQLLEGFAPSRTERVVWDPFCGSGVLPLEWLRFRAGHLPGAQRAFAFQSWPTFPAAEWEAHRRRALAGASTPTLDRALGSDLDAKAVLTATANAERAELQAVTRFWVADFRAAAAEVPVGAAVLTNPPYGKRLGSPERARLLYRQLQELLQARADLRPVVLACPDPTFLRRERGWKVLTKTRHGGLSLSFVALT